MSAEYVWGAIFIMMGVTYISRIIPFLLLAGKPVPRWFKTWLTYVPTAIFGALVLPDVFLPAGSLDLGLNNLYLCGRPSSSSRWSIKQNHWGWR